MGVFLKTMAASFKGAGGIFMWLIFIPLVVAVGLIIERVWVLYIKAGFSSKKLINGVVKKLKEGDFDGALALAKKYKTPLARVIITILENRDRSEEEIQKLVEEVFLEETPRIQRNLPLLSAMANVATLLGLLGTIIGLILAFDAVANVPAAQRSKALATGISVAMATTAFGLLIAVPVLFLHGLFSAQSEKILEEMDEVSAKLMNIVLIEKKVS